MASESLVNQGFWKDSVEMAVARDRALTQVIIADAKNAQKRRNGGSPR